MKLAKKESKNVASKKAVATKMALRSAETETHSSSEETDSAETTLASGDSEPPSLSGSQVQPSSSGFSSQPASQASQGKSAKMAKKLWRKRLSQGLYSKGAKSMGKSTYVSPEKRLLKKLRKNRGTFKYFVYKVLKQVHPDHGITTRAMQIMDDILVDVFQRIAREAAVLARKNKKPTISSREIQGATKLLFHGTLAEHAAKEGIKAVEKFRQNREH